MKRFRSEDVRKPPARERNSARGFHGGQRTNDAHTFTNGPETGLYRKGKGMEAKSAYMSISFREPTSLSLYGRVSESSAVERDLAQPMFADLRSGRKITVRGDNGSTSLSNSSTQRRAGASP